MRRTKRFAGFALAACMGVSLLVNVPAGTVSAAEPGEVVTAEVSATKTDAEALDEAQEVVYDESKADAYGFVWDGTTLVKYVGKGGDVKIPEGCTRIGADAFSECSGLTSIVVSPENPYYSSEGNCNAIIETETNTLIRGCKNTKIPSSVTSIKRSAFSDCSGLTSIKIPSSVTSIGMWAFDESGLKTIYGTSGSYAETYAKNQHYEFIDPANPVVIPDVTTSYRTHVQSFGWQNLVTNGVMSGTSGKAKRLEGIEISVSGNKNLGIQYSTHCQTYGWLPWSANGGMNGTTGEAKRLEAIKIQLTGADKDKYDVYYRVHAQSYGWLGWAKNGEESGTAGFAKRLEGIQIVLVPKGGAAPANNYMGIQSVNTKAYIKK